MSQADITKGLKSLADSREAYETAEGYYTGDIAEYFSNSRIKRHLGDGGKAFRIPFSAIPVDSRIDLVDIARITVDQARLQPVVDAIVEANDLDTELIDVYRKAAYFGDFYVLAWLAPDEEDVEVEDIIEDPDADAEDGGDVVNTALVDAARSTVEVFLNSPLSFRVIYSSENAREPMYAIKVWEADDSTLSNQPGDADKKRWRVNLYYRDRVEQWVSSKGRGNSRDGSDFEPYTLTDDPEDSIVENPFGDFPFFHFRQGGKPYGVPVHRRGFGAQDALTKLNATHMATVDYIGFPQRYAVRKDDESGDVGDDDFADFDPAGSPTAPTKTVSPSGGRSKLKPGPGELWWLEGVDQVGQFESAGAEAFLDPMKFQIAAMGRLTGTPSDEFQVGDMSANPPSGEARRKSREALYKAVRTMEKGWGATTAALLEFCLTMLGEPDAKVTVTYAPLDMMSGTDDWTMIESKLKNGVPLRTVLSEAGYSEEDIEEWYPDDEPALSISQLTAVSSILGSLATAGATLSMVTPAIRRVLPEFFVGGDATEVVRPPIDAVDLEVPPVPPALQA